MATLFALPPEAGSVAHDMLRRARIPTRLVGSWQELERAAPESNVLVLAVPRLDARDVLARLHHLGALTASVPTVLVTSPDPENLRNLAGLRVCRVLFGGREEARLPDVVLQATLDSPFLRMADRIREMPHLPRIVRRALMHALLQTPAPAPLDPNDPAAPARSIAALAAKLGVSADHLARSATRAGVDLRLFLDWVVALRAIQLRAAGPESWERIAWRLGFASGSGLSAHLRRVLGTRPRDLDPAHLPDWLARFEHDRIESLALPPSLGTGDR